MVYIFFTRALVVLTGMVVVGFASYYLLAELFNSKQPNLVSKDSFVGISVVEGIVKNIYTTPTTTTPARIEVQGDDGLVKTVVIQPWANCRAANIFDVSQVTAGDRVVAKGALSKRGDIFPCDDIEHYFTLVQDSNQAPLFPGSQEVMPQSDNEASDAIVFSGTLDSFHSGCINGGECYVLIDGRKVTLSVGQSTQPVGTLLDVNLTVLQEYIGQRFEVYALSLGNDTYTLYGNTAFYMRPL
jgi:hypothetical protein